MAEVLCWVEWWLDGDVAWLSVGSVMLLNAGSAHYGSRVLFLPESAFSADSLTVFVQPLCAITCINICVHVTNPIGSHTIVWTLKNTAHTRSNPGDGMWMPEWQGN